MCMLVHMICFVECDLCTWLEVGRGKVIFPLLDILLYSLRIILDVYIALYTYVPHEPKFSPYFFTKHFVVALSLGVS